MNPADIIFQITALLQDNAYLFKDTLTLEEASKFSGFSKSCLYKKVESRKIGAFKPDGGKIFIDKAELEKHMRTNRILSMEELKDRGANHLRKSA